MTYDSDPALHLAVHQEEHALGRVGDRREHYSAGTIGEERDEDSRAEVDEGHPLRVSDPPLGK